MSSPPGPASGSSAARTATFTAFRLLLFITSYAPLALIFAWQCQTLPATIAWIATSLIAATIGIALTTVQLRKVASPIILDSVDERGGEVAGYLATYLLPFLTGPPSTPSAIAAFGTYFAVAAIIAIQSRVILVNPTLYIFGWKVAEIEAGQVRRLLLCRRLPRKGDTIYAVTFIEGLIRKS